MKCRTAIIKGVVLTGILAQSRTASACAVCFGASDKSVTFGLAAAILSLLAILVCIFAGVISFFINIHKRSRKMAVTV